MRDAVVEHDLSSSDLVVARVHLPAEDLVQSTGPCEDQMGGLRLHDPLAQASQVGPDADGPAGDESHGDDLVESSAHLPRYHGRPAETFDSYSVFFAWSVGKNRRRYFIGRCLWIIG